MARRPLLALATASITDLQREISRREACAEVLQRWEALLEKPAAWDADLGAKSPARAKRGSRGRPHRGPGRPRQPRPRSETTLVDALSAVPEGKTLGVAEAADAIRKAGYKSNAASFRIMVNGALSKPPFTRVARGKYTAK